MTGSTKESGMTLMAVMVFMTIFAFILMVAAPSIQMDVQREKELESIRRGEEIAEQLRRCRHRSAAGQGDPDVTDAANAA